MDKLWLNAAFYQASFALGNTGKNPAVGCVIIKNDQIIGLGHTSENGRPHAEENALKMAGKDALGATMYLTLEPCCLEDNINSCTNQIINSGIKKVIIGMLDYNKLTFKRGLKTLIKNGIEAKMAELSFKNFLFNYPQYCYHVLERPSITIKLANSADSKITYANGDSKWITSKLSRKHVHQIRSNYDAILVGKNTSNLDNPSLTVRVKGLKKKIFRILLDTNLSLTSNAKLTSNITENPLIIFTAKDLTANKAKYFLKKGIKIYKIKKVANGLLCVKSIIRILHSLKLRNILIEGGAKTASTFLNMGYCDFIYIYKSNTFVGSDGLHTFYKINEQSSFFLYNEVQLKDNKLEIWTNNQLRKIYKKII